MGPQFPIIVRLSLDELAEGGNTIEDSLELMKYFCDEADIFSVSAGLNTSLQFQIDVGSLPDGWRSYMAESSEGAVWQACYHHGKHPVS